MVEAADLRAVRWPDMSRTAPDKAAFSPKLNVLVALPYVSSDMMEAFGALGEECRFALDSGAFTAHRLGTPITLDEYCRMLDAIPVKPWRYFTLDVWGNQDASKANYDTMCERGYRPIPIVTRGGPEALALADHYWETTDIVGFGALKTARQHRAPYVKAVLEHARGRKLHLLGFCSTPWIVRYRPFMMDASSWEQSGRYGRFTLYLGDGRWWSVARHECQSEPPAHVLNAVRALGFDGHLLKQEANWRGEISAARCISAASWIRYSIDVERRFGTKVFLALAAARGDVLTMCYRAQKGELDGEAERQRMLEAGRRRGSETPHQNLYSAIRRAA